MLSEDIIFRKEISTPLEPATVHHAGAAQVIPFNKAIWKTDPNKAQSILLGAEIFYQTKKYAPQYVGNALSCTQCHFNGGRQEGMLGLIDIASLYPHYEARSHKTIDLKERLQSCFLRSENGKAPPTDDPLLQNLNDYVTALTVGKPNKKDPDWMDFITIAKNDRIPIESLDPAKGKILFEQKCAACHMSNGQGDQWAPPLWGDSSFNDGAGLGRIYTLASFVHDAMPLSDPTSLSPADAQQIAAYVDAHDRPNYSGKDQDYVDETIPPDAVYYTRRYPQNPMKVKLESGDSGKVK
jgi:thiosulfate dehydrogenase